MRHSDLRIQCRWLLVAAAAPLLLACDQSLSRSDAAAKIRQAYGFPQDETRGFESSQSGGQVRFPTYPNDPNDPVCPSHPCEGVRYAPGGGSIEPKSAMYEQLANDGFATIRTIPDTVENWLDPYGSPRMITIRYRYDAELTTKASPYVSNGMLKVATLDFGEVTGIVNAPERNTAQVDFTVRRTVTPLGPAFGLSDEAMTRSAVFTKYDDGWRLTAQR